MSEEKELELVLEQCEDVVNRKIPLLVLAPEYTKVLMDYIKQLKNDNVVMKAGLIQMRDERLEQYKSVLDEIILQLKVERKFALSLNKPYTVSVIDKLLDKVKE